MAPDSTPDDETAIDEDEKLTDSTNARWTYLGSVLSAIIIIVFLLLTGAGVVGNASLSSIPTAWFYVFALLVLTAGGWVFGADLVDAYRNK
jgi:hypothetical protein